MMQVLCDGTWVNSSHRRSDNQDDVQGVLHVSMDSGFFGEKESEEQVAPVPVIRERRHKMNAGSEKKELNFPGLRREQRSSLISLGTTESHSGVTTNQRWERLQEKSDKPAKKSDCARETASGRKPVQWCHRTRRGARGRSGQNTESCA